jgi:hypothetical protein
VVPPPFVYMGHQKREKDGLSAHLSPVSPVHNGITPLSSVPELSLAKTEDWKTTSAKSSEELLKKPPPTPKAKISKWILFNLWFNTYRKFFTFVTILNLVGIIMAALNRFPYAENHLGALVLGNLLCAVMFRNELWMRFLYMVCIYGLRGVCHTFPDFWRPEQLLMHNHLVGTCPIQARSDLVFAACWRHTFRVRIVRRGVRRPIFTLANND